MKINSISLALVTFAALISGGTAMAAEQSTPKSTRADDMFEAKTAGKPEVRTRDVADKVPESPSAMKSSNTARKVVVRNTRPQADHHKDARACLKAGNSEAIARCSRKYH